MAMLEASSRALDLSTWKGARSAEIGMGTITIRLARLKMVE